MPKFSLANSWTYSQ